MVYQLMFAIITPALITGPTAERVKFKRNGPFMTLCPGGLCGAGHMVWGQRRLLNAVGRQVPMPGCRGRNGRAHIFWVSGAGVRPSTLGIPRGSHQRCRHPPAPKPARRYVHDRSRREDPAWEPASHGVQQFRLAPRTMWRQRRIDHQEPQRHKKGPFR